VTKGETVILRASISDPRGIVSTELRVNHDISPEDQVMMNEVPAKPSVTQLTQHLFWTPMSIGQYTVSVIAVNNKGEKTETAPMTLYVVDNEVQRTAVADKLITATPTITPPPTLTPTTTLTPTALPPTSPPLATLTPLPSPSQTQIPTPTQLCTDSAAFVADVTVPSGSLIIAGGAFDKTWRLQNNGTCTWDSTYRLAFVDGDQMSASSPIPLPRTIYPNDIVDITVPMVAPAAAGEHAGRWQMQDGIQQNFGSIIYLQIQVADF